MFMRLFLFIALFTIVSKNSGSLRASWCLFYTFYKHVNLPNNEYALQPKPVFIISVENVASYAKEYRDCLIPTGMKGL